MTPKICDELKDKYENIIVVHKENQGTSKARETGIKTATGDYIAFVDSDDYIDSTTYEETIKILEENSCDIVQYGIYSVLPNGEIISEKSEPPLTLGNKQDIFLYFFSLPGSLVDKIYKRSLFENLEWLQLTFFEDYHILMQTLSKAQKLMRIDKIFYYVVKNSESVTHRPYSIKYSDDGIKAGNFVVKFTEKNFPEFLPEALSFKLNLIHHAFMYCANSQYSDKKKVLKQLNHDINESYDRLQLELQKRSSSLKIRKEFVEGLKYSYTFKDKARTWLFMNCPGAAILYLKIRVKIHDLTGI